MYYHASYWGRPHDYLWLSSTNPYLIHEEMMKAYELNNKEIWILNVGDIKPAEYNMQLFMDMAYDAESFKNPLAVKKHKEAFFKETFNEELGTEIADIKQKYYQLAFERKPEFMGWSQTERTTPIYKTDYNALSNGDEIQQRIDAYVSLETGIGALILFASVQITMILVGLILGDKLHSFEWLGVIVAFSGFVYLVAPSITSPSLTGFMLMALSGAAWAGYTFAGKGSLNPLTDTTFNFLRTLPFIIVLAAVTFTQAELSLQGVLLAIMSGGITSAIGYTIWYIALRDLTAIQAAVVQLLVPVIAAFGGVIFASETLSLHLTFSSLMVLGGVVLVILSKNHKQNSLRKN